MPLERFSPVENKLKLLPDIFASEGFSKDEV